MLGGRRRGALDRLARSVVRLAQRSMVLSRNDHFLAPEIGDDALLGATPNYEAFSIRGHTYSLGCQ
jgi:hypothetical protein